MVRQLILIGLSFCSVAPFALAKPPTTSTYVVPSPTDEKNQIQKESELQTDAEANVIDKGLDLPNIPPSQNHSLQYHLPLRPSATFAFSRNYDFKDDTNDGWIGLHGSPWVEPTSRWQLGIDIHKKTGWVQLAYHFLPTRNSHRPYWGFGASLLINSEDELRPALRLKNYYGSAIAGWEFQLMDNQSFRAEVSLHQSFERTLIKGLLGYTLLL